VHDGRKYKRTRGASAAPSNPPFRSTTDQHDGWCVPPTRFKSLRLICLAVKLLFTLSLLCLPAMADVYCYYNESARLPPGSLSRTSNLPR
jgi:hypothetical protein